MSAIRASSLPAWGVRVEIGDAQTYISWPCSSLPAWGVRVEIWARRSASPHTASLPAWGVRVEIRRGCQSTRYRYRHSPHGECGLKYAGEVGIEILNGGHSPHGKCGLKSSVRVARFNVVESLPAWGVRVEIPPRSPKTSSTWSLPAWGVRVETVRVGWQAER